MNRRERFQNFIENKPVDRVPVGFWHHFCDYAELDTGLTNPEAFEKNVLGHKRSKEIGEPDVVKIMTDSVMTIPVDVSKIEKSSDLRSLEPISLHSDYVKKSLELVCRVRDIYGPDVPIFTTGFTPLFPLRRVMTVGDMYHRDESRFLSYMQEDPESVSCALDILGQRIAEIHKLLVTESGIDGIYVAVNNRSHFLDDDVYRAYVAPHEKAVLEAANKVSKVNLLHICGYAGMTNNLELYRDYPAPAVNWSVTAEGYTLGQGKKFFGGKAVIGGFEQQGVLYTGTKEEVEKRTFELLDEAGQLGVMLGADCTVPGDIDEKRFGWVREAAAKYAESHT